MASTETTSLTSTNDMISMRFPSSNAKITHNKTHGFCLQAKLQHFFLPERVSNYAALRSDLHSTAATVCILTTILTPAGSQDTLTNKKVTFSFSSTRFLFFHNRLTFFSEFYVSILVSCLPYTQIVVVIIYV